MPWMTFQSLSQNWLYYYVGIIVHRFFFSLRFLHLNVEIHVFSIYFIWKTINYLNLVGFKKKKSYSCICRIGAQEEHANLLVLLGVFFPLNRFWLKLQWWAWIWVMWVCWEWIKHGFLTKKKAVQGDQELGGKAMFSNRNLLCGHCGDDVLIEPQTVWFFRPEVSFKQARKRVMYLSGAPLAPSPWLHCSNVNGGLGAVSWDPPPAPPKPYHCPPSFSFPLRQLVSFKGSWPSDWCVIAPNLTCPLTALFIGQAVSTAFC